MKTTLKLLSVFFALLILPSFIQIKPRDGFNHYELKQNEVIKFTDKQNSGAKTISGSFSRGSYDSSAYTIKYDNERNLNLKDFRGCTGKHQNEISLHLCSGKISRNHDTLRIQAKTLFKMFYLINIQKNGIVDSFISGIQIDIVSRTLKNEYCPSLVTSGLELSGGVTYIVALPKDVNPEEVWKPIHKDETVGIFTYFAVKDAKGKSKVYPPGDYVLIGGNSLNISH